MTDAPRIDPTALSCPACGYELRHREVLYNDKCWRCFKVENAIEQTLLLREIRQALQGIGLGMRVPEPFLGIKDDS